LVEPDDGVYDRIDPYWIDFEMTLVPMRNCPDRTHFILGQTLKICSSYDYQ